MENINLDKIIKADELDFNMILNVPEDIGKKIHQIIQNQQTPNQPLQDVNIEIIENPSDSMKIEDSRKMIFKFGDSLHPISILDFPCIIEANKTIDFKTFYKSGDISQMFYVHSDNLKNENDLIHFSPFNSIDENFKNILWKKDYDHKYKLKHGLSKCTRNIRAKRFKRKIPYNHDEILEVAKKLKNIIDNGAANFESQMNKTINTENEDNLTFNDGKSVKGSVMEGDSVVNGMNHSTSIKIQANKNNNNIIIHTDGGDGGNINNDKRKKDGNSNSNNNNDNNDNSNKLSISLPISIINNYESNVNDNLNEQMKLNEEKQNILNKYSELKDEYNKLKEMLEKMENKPPELVKKKKGIKKQLKTLRSQYKDMK